MSQSTIDKLLGYQCKLNEFLQNSKGNTDNKQQMQAVMHAITKFSKSADLGLQEKLDKLNHSLEDWNPDNTANKRCKRELMRITHRIEDTMDSIADDIIQNGNVVRQNRKTLKEQYELNKKQYQLMQEMHTEVNALNRGQYETYGAVQEVQNAVNRNGKKIDKNGTLLVGTGVAACVGAGLHLSEVLFNS